MTTPAQDELRDWIEEIRKQLRNDHWFPPGVPDTISMETKHLRKLVEFYDTASKKAEDDRKRLGDFRKKVEDEIKRMETQNTKEAEMYAIYELIGNIDGARWVLKQFDVAVAELSSPTERTKE